MQSSLINLRGWKSRTSGVLVLTVVLAATLTQLQVDDRPCFEASAAPAADALFRGHPNWVGADGAFSIDLKNGRTLWLFGDTWIDSSGRNMRSGATMIRNSVAVQVGANPASASMEYFWRTDRQGVPGAFFEREGDEWYWPGHGVRVGDRLILFLNRLRATDTGLGFESTGWNAVLVENPDDHPPAWRITDLETAPNSLGIIVGFASVLQRRQHVYAFGSADRNPSHPVYAIRWRVDDLARGDLSKPQWWGGQQNGWISHDFDQLMQPIFDDGQSELSIFFDEFSAHFVAVQTVGFGRADIAFRAAKSVAGPWSEANVVFRPPDNYRPNIMIYAAKAHPHLSKSATLLSYATNTFVFEEHLTDSEIYYPRFVLLERCK